MCRMPAGRSTLEWLTGRWRTFDHRCGQPARDVSVNRHGTARRRPSDASSQTVAGIVPQTIALHACYRMPAQHGGDMRAACACCRCRLTGVAGRHAMRASESGASCASGHDAPCREQTPCAVVHCEIGQPPIMKAQTHVRAGRQGGTAGHTAVTPLPPPCRADVTDSAGAKTFRVRVRGRDAPASARLERGKYRDKARPEGLRRARPEGEGRTTLFQNCLKSHR